ncbi:MAG: ABC transporter ATP-binding protein [Thaumarchaeota archaeon]|nr:ABC transporter ATP-binding protein [Nitrososphaerota archaeon]
MSDVVIELKNIYKTFKLNYKEKTTVYETLVTTVKKKSPSQTFNALSNISFSVKKGEMLGIIGHNGSGKSTLLKVICHILPPSQGSIKTKGKIIPFLQLGSGFNGDLTAIENIKMYGMILGIQKNKIAKKIPEILEYAELESFKDTKVKHFSSGMFARLAFATAIQSEPDILVIDETLSVGDLAFQQKSFNTFLDIKKQNTTIIYVTHNLDDVLRLCDRAILLYKGFVGDVGDPKLIVDKYKTVVEKSPDYIEESLAKEIGVYYQKILKRPPDVIGMLDHFYRIKKGEISLNDIPSILKNSEEYVSIHG